MRETGSIRTLAISIGRPASADEVIEQLTRIARERGGLPLVLVTDNGGPYRSEQLARWLALHGVLHHLTLPHTPQHKRLRRARLRRLEGAGGRRRVAAHRGPRRRARRPARRRDPDRLQPTPRDARLAHRHRRRRDARPRVGPHHPRAGLRDSALQDPASRGGLSRRACSTPRDPRGDPEHVRRMQPHTTTPREEAAERVIRGRCFVSGTAIR